MILGMIILASLLATAGVGDAAPAQDQFQRQFIDEWKVLARENRLELIAVLPNYPPLYHPPTLAAQGSPWTDRVDSLAIKWRVTWRVSHGYLLLGSQYVDSHQVKTASQSGVIPSQERELSSLPLHEPEKRALAFLESLTPEQRAAIARDGSLPMASFSATQFEQMKRAMPGPLSSRAKAMGPETPGFVRFILMPSLYVFSNGRTLGIVFARKRRIENAGFNPADAESASRLEAGDPRGAPVEIIQPEIPMTKFVQAVAAASCAHKDVTVDPRLDKDPRLVYISKLQVPLGPAQDFVSKALRGQIRVLGPLCHVGYLGDLPSETDALGSIALVRHVLRALSGLSLRPSARFSTEGMQRLYQAHPQICEGCRPLFRVELPAETWSAIEALDPQLRGVGRYPKVAVACHFSIVAQPIAVDEPRQPGDKERTVGLGLIMLNIPPGTPVDSLVGEPLPTP
ncbi:MAG TPA: hypothetical protein VHS28_05225 [Chloroflexota bacterium]|nr:hypothetical protein [Chloroflexota bacterium]